jgi:hypothetical protein
VFLRAVAPLRFSPDFANNRARWAGGHSGGLRQQHHPGHRRLSVVATSPSVVAHVRTREVLRAYVEAGGGKGLLEPAVSTEMIPVLPTMEAV